MSTAAALARRGVEMTVLMPQGRGDEGLTAADLRAYFGVEGDFRLVQHPSRWAGEALPLTLMWLRQVFHAPALNGADLLYSRIPAMLALDGVPPLPFATDHYRPWPDDLPLVRPLIRRTSRHPNCLGFVIHSDHAAGAYRRAGVDPARILVAHNGAAPRPAGAALGRSGARVRLGLPPDRPIAAYAGRINGEKGLDQVLGLAALRPESLFLLVGAEGESAIAAEAARQANVRVVSWQPPPALPLWLEAADVLLIPASSAPLERFGNCVLPMKLFSYLAAGRPILAPAAPDTAELLLDGGNALLVPPDRPDLAAAALDRILYEPGLAQRLSQGALRSAAGLTWDGRAEKIAFFLEARLSARNK